jgi:hypothetical protein
MAKKSIKMKTTPDVSACAVVNLVMPAKRPTTKVKKVTKKTKKSKSSK